MKKPIAKPCCCGEAASRRMLDMMTPAERKMFGPGRLAAKAKRHSVIRKYMDKVK